MAKRRRDEQSPVDLLFADLIRAETKADFVFLPGVGYGVAIPPGPITAAQLRQLVPHDGKVVTMRLPGARIVEILEQAVENVVTADSAVKVGGMIQVSGLRFKYRVSDPFGHRVDEIVGTSKRWNPANDFVVATNSMLAQGGHNQKSLKAGFDVTEHESQFELIKRMFQHGGEMRTPPDVRIERIRDGK